MRGWTGPRPGFLLRTLGFAGTPAGSGLLEHEDVLVGDQVHRDALAAGLADLLELEERRPGQQFAVADRGQQRDAPLQQDEPGGGAGADDRRGQVDEFAVFAPRPGGDDDDAAGAQQGVAAGAGCR